MQMPRLHSWGLRFSRPKSGPGKESVSFQAGRPVEQCSDTIKQRWRCCCQVASYRDPGSVTPSCEPLDYETFSLNFLI